MPYKKYNSANNAFATLATPLADTDVTMVLQWKYGRMPTSNFIVKITKTVAWVVTARENVYVTTRSGATCTGLTRAYEPVPVDDNATSNIQQALNFATWDLVEVVISTEFAKDMQDAISWKVDTVAWLRTWFWVNKTVYVEPTTWNEVIKDSTVGSSIWATELILLRKTTWEENRVPFSVLQSSLSSQWLVENVYYASQTISQGESLFLEQMETFAAATNAENISDVTANTRHEIPMFWNWVSFSTIKAALRKVGTPTQNLNFRIETDNAWNPSGTLFHANWTAAVTQASLSTSFADTTVTFSGSMTIPVWQKVWIIMFQGTYGTETINNTNYYQIGTGTKHSSWRPSVKYNGTIHTTEKPTSTSTWTWDTFVGALNWHTVAATANGNIKIYTVTKTSSTAWTTCVVSQGGLSQSVAFSGNVATFATPVLIAKGGFSITFSWWNLNTYQASSQTATDPLITVGATPYSLRWIDCKAQWPKAYLSSTWLLDSMLAKTSAAIEYKLWAYPRVATTAASAWAICQNTIAWLTDLSGISEWLEYFVWDTEWTISTTQWLNKMTIGRWIWAKLNVGRFQSWLKNILNAAVSTTTAWVMHHGWDMMFAYNFLNAGTAPTVTIQTSTDFWATWTTYFTISNAYVQSTTAWWNNHLTIQVPQWFVRVQTNSTATVAVYH